MKKRNKIIIAISIVVLLIVGGLSVYFITKIQDDNYTHIVYQSFDTNFNIDFGYVKNAKVENYCANFRVTYIKVPDSQYFIDNNIKTHECYKTTRLDVDNNEEIILAKDGYILTLTHNKESNLISINDNFGYCNDYLFPFITTDEVLVSWDENDNTIYEHVLTYEELNYSIYNKKYVTDIFTDYESIKQFYIENCSADKFIANDELKTIQLKVTRWHYNKSIWSSDYPIEIVCRENDIFLHVLNEDII